MSLNILEKAASTKGKKILATITYIPQKHVRTKCIQTVPGSVVNRLPVLAKYAIAPDDTQSVLLTSDVDLHRTSFLHEHRGVQQQALQRNMKLRIV
jgi:hypothetical protein